MNSLKGSWVSTFSLVSTPSVSFMVCVSTDWIWLAKASTTVSESATYYFLLALKVYRHSWDASSMVKAKSLARISLPSLSLQKASINRRITLIASELSRSFDWLIYTWTMVSNRMSRDCVSEPIVEEVDSSTIASWLPVKNFKLAASMKRLFSFSLLPLSRPACRLRYNLKMSLTIRSS